MVHFQLLLAFALCGVSLAAAPGHNPYEVRERLRERERERERRPWRLESVREIPYGREGPERERLLEREKVLERIALERNIQNERLDRERIDEERNIRGPIGYGLQPERHYEYGHGRGLNELYGYGLGIGHGPSYSLVPWLEPTKGVLSNGHSGNIELQNKIVRDAFSPAYNQPEYIIDYRFLRSGGRAFVRGPGGQIIILPRGVKEVEPHGHNSYDRLIEELQLEEEHTGKVPYRRIVVEGEGRSGYRQRDRVEERRGELGYQREVERRDEYTRGYEEGLGRRRQYGLGRIPREEKAETVAAAPEVQTAEIAPQKTA